MTSYHRRAIKALQEGKMKAKVAKKGKNIEICFNLWVIH
jgi:hypothetical protein